MAGGKEGHAMDRASVLQAERVASTLQMTDLQEEDEVEEWLAKAADIKERIASSGPDGLPGEKITEMEHMEVDEAQLDEERNQVALKFNVRLRPTALAGEAEGVVVEGREVDDDESGSSSEDDDGHHVTQDDEDDWHKKGMHVFDEEYERQFGKQRALPKEIAADVFDSPERKLSQEEEDEKAKEAVRKKAYGGKVYAGMSVRPRGMGTPRRDMIGAEMMRTAYLAKPKDGVVGWGRIAYSKHHFEHDVNAPAAEEGEAHHEETQGDAGKDSKRKTLKDGQPAQESGQGGSVAAPSGDAAGRKSVAGQGPSKSAEGSPDASPTA